MRCLSSGSWPPANRSDASEIAGPRKVIQAMDQATSHTSQPPADDNRPDPVLERFWAALRRLPRYLALGVNLTRDKDVPKRAKASVLMGGAYAVSPVDLVPGIIPVAGQLDDMVVILLALRRALRGCPPDVAADHLQRAGLTDGDLDADLAACWATVRWVGAKGLRLGGRFATSMSKRLGSARNASP